MDRMYTVHEVSALTGVSARALRHYDRIGLLPPTATSEAGYRLYDEAALIRLQCIMLYKTLEFPLKDIRAILDSPAFDRNRALDQQIALLELKRQHFDNLLHLAKGIRGFGIDANHLTFEAFDTTKIEQYAAEARSSWEDNAALREYKRKSARRTPELEKRIGEGLLQLLAAFGALKALPPGAPEVRAQVERLRDYVTAHYYPCTDAILRGFGAIYAGGGSMTERVDAAGGPGTGAFIAAAIDAFTGI